MDILPLKLPLGKVEKGRPNGMLAVIPPTASAMQWTVPVAVPLNAWIDGGTDVAFK